MNSLSSSPISTLLCSFSHFPPSHDYSAIPFRCVFFWYLDFPPLTFLMEMESGVL